MLGICFAISFNVAIWVLAMIRFDIGFRRQRAGYEGLVGCFSGQVGSVIACAVFVHGVISISPRLMAVQIVITAMSISAFLILRMCQVAIITIIIANLFQFYKLN